MSARLLALTPGTLRPKRLKDGKETAQRTQKQKWGESDLLLLLLWRSPVLNT